MFLPCCHFLLKSRSHAMSFPGSQTFRLRLNYPTSVPVSPEDRWKTDVSWTLLPCEPIPHYKISFDILVIYILGYFKMFVEEQVFVLVIKAPVGKLRSHTGMPRFRFQFCSPFQLPVSIHLWRRQVMVLITHMRDLD